MTAPAKAASTVECHSIDYQYTECSAGSLTKPQLINQISSSACILNRTWGYNPRSGYLWVAQGCSGVFADVAGYHYGRGDGYDSNARMYNDHGHDVGAAIGGAIIGALIEGMVTSNHSDYKHETSNYARPSRGSGYDGCHGTGCLLGSDSAPEPGQTEFRGNDSPPEPGQQEMTGPEN
ncbi:DUF3011 domain-containing protein [Sandaracinobacter neustonicus]|nr:DUF3011 domain-containing protein [Sandaracinobacter neustonicus]